MKCDLCGADVSDEKIKHVHIKGHVKNICEGCVTSVKGLI
jgi:ribosome-binding protein aMBF1 (putative translation factor)